MSMEFLILQGNTQSINTINYKIALTTMERRSIQDDITSATEMMQQYEDDVDTLIGRRKDDAKVQYDISLANLETETNEIKAEQTKASNILGKAKSSVVACQSEVKKAEVMWERVKNNPNDPQYQQAKDIYEKAQEKLKLAEETRDSAQAAYDNAVELYSTASTDNATAQKKAYTDYQALLTSIESEKKSLLNPAKSAQKANLERLKKEDSRLELSLNELNDMKEMLKAEKDSAKEATEQKAQDLAPKYG